MGLLAAATLLLVFGADRVQGNCNVGDSMIKVEIEGFGVYFDAASKATYDTEPVKSNINALFAGTVKAVRFLAPNATEEVLAILRATKVILHSKRATAHDDGHGTAWAMNGFEHECADGTPGGGSEGCVEGHNFNSSDTANGNLVEWLSPVGGKASSLLLHELAHAFYFHLNPDRTSNKQIVAVVEAFAALTAKHDEIKAKHAAPQASGCNVWGSCSYDDYAFSNHGEFHAELSEALASDDRGWENDKWPNTRAELRADAGEAIMAAVEASWAFDPAGLAKAEREACVSREIPACKGCACEKAILQTLGCFVDGSPGPGKCKAECYHAYTEYITCETAQHTATVKMVQDSCTPPATTVAHVHTHGAKTSAAPSVNTSASGATSAAPPVTAAAAAATTVNTTASANDDGAGAAKTTAVTATVTIPAGGNLATMSAADIAVLVTQFEVKVKAACTADAAAAACTDATKQLADAKEAQAKIAAGEFNGASTVAAGFAAVAAVTVAQLC